MASDLISDLVMTAFERRPAVHLMGNPAVVGYVLKLTKLAKYQKYWYIVAPPGIANVGRVFKIQASIQG